MKQQHTININEHPIPQYSVHQIFMIKKQSLAMSNQQVVRRLSRSFNRIKKLRAQNVTLLNKQYDYQNSAYKQQFRKIHQIYNTNSKSSMITKKKIEKLKGAVQRGTKQIKSSQLYATKDIDMAKMYTNQQKNTTATATTTTTKTK